MVTSYRTILQGHNQDTGIDAGTVKIQNISVSARIPQVLLYSGRTSERVLLGTPL